MQVNNPYNSNYRKELAKNLPSYDNYAKTGLLIGNNVKGAEKAYLEAQRSNDPGKIAAAEANYQKAMRVYQTFSQLMKNSYQMLSEIIRNISFR